MLTTSALPSFSTLPPPFQAALKQIPQSNHYYVALSGGMDSVCLLIALLSYTRRNETKNATSVIKAIHVHHGLSSNADKWAEFCQALCRNMDVECFIEKVDVVEGGEGLEAAARKARYAVFERYLDKGDVLLQGHHRNDQAESFLFKAVKGLGPQALAGIPRERALSQGSLFRPFLSINRSDLQVWANEIGAEWVEDESNLDTKYDRNFIRREVLPVFEERWSEAVAGLANSADKTRQLVDQENQWCAYHLDQIKVRDEYDYELLHIERLQLLPEMLQRSVVRFWLDTLRLEQPSEKIFNRIWFEVLTPKPDAQPEIRWGANRLVRFNGGLYLAPPEESTEEYSYSLDLSDRVEETEFRCGSYLVTVTDCQEAGAFNNACMGASYRLTIPANESLLRISSRRGGEKLRLPGNQHRTELKKCFQQWKTPPWLRHAPLFFMDDELVVVGFGGRASGFSLDSLDNPSQGSPSKEGARVLSISVKSLA